ncbi:hypothetical protein CUMW_192050 [Citrus unshiu]|uniref:CTLH domain-containing protein n=1 Tax=Citrus unshiu TaxID=55188 RepID=A0A2H5Q387_CITUN|nr:hypothetical protein CUMW_192050 [Citrus unshiu]
MSSLSRELVFLILQFLDEEKFKETVHKLEQESGFFFNMKYFEDEVHNGNWDDVEKYLSGFTKVDDNRYSMKIFFEIRKQKYLEALDKHDRAKAVEILVKDLKVFSTFNEELFKEITQLLTLENFRENEQLSKYGDTKSARSIMLVELKKLIEANPLFRDKLQFPNLKNSRLRTLINQSILVLVNGYTVQGMSTDHLSKRTRPIGISDEINLPVNVLPVSFTGHSHSHSHVSFSAPEDLPKTVTRTLNQGSSPMSMDFHPVQQTLLLVGTNVGDIGLWDSWERLVLRNFKAALEYKDPGVCLLTVSYGARDVAYSRHIVQIYSYNGGDEVQQHLEIDARVGGVNDIAFSHPNKQLCVITCGDDKTIKVWDATNGTKQYIFEGHEAPFHLFNGLDGKIKAWLYAQFGISVDYEAPGPLVHNNGYSADDGESFIVEWNESEGAVKRTYQGFRKRSLGVVQFDTTKNRFLAAGDDFSIKFWDMDNVQLLTSIDADGGLPASPRIRFNKDGCLLAVSTNDNGIKILATSDGIRLLRTFENLSYDASRTSENSKPTISPISAAAAAAATSAGLADRAASMVSIPGMNGDVRSLADVKPRITEESNDKSKVWKLTELSEPNQCRSLRLPENLRATKISRLIFTNSGNAILALASNAIHLLWKWQRTERNSSGKATASVAPQLWQPPSGIMMTNDVTDSNPEEAVPCFALSKNDSYVMSASGGKISLFNMMTFKTMATFMPPPPAATFLAFHPQDNNIIAIGMDDSSIQIYNVRVDEVKSKLKGHSKRITGLAFSHALNVLVSSGADSQLCVWGSDGWEKQKNRFLQIPTGRTPTAQSDTRVQFHQDQIHFLVVHETQLAIFETTKLECVKQWVPRESSAPITHATFSCDSQLVYACFLDATVCVFSAANLKLRCRINPSAYLPAGVSSSNVHPLVIAAHPHEPNEFALGLSDGGVHVFEPLESEGKWGVPPPVDNGSTSSMPATPPVGGSGSDQAQR